MGFIWGNENSAEKGISIDCRKEESHYNDFKLNFT